MYGSRKSERGDTQRRWTDIDEGNQKRYEEAEVTAIGRIGVGKMEISRRRMEELIEAGKMRKTYKKGISIRKGKWRTARRTEEKWEARRIDMKGRGKEIKENSEIKWKN
ncbi:Protein of unknown function [Gryllus bimaculatus]|nr:Protein of unknown function [Gryllus bimaculatus]